jgi:hypothetical protein
MLVVRPSTLEAGENVSSTTIDRSCKECVNAAREGAPFEDGSCDHCTAPMLGIGSLKCKEWTEQHSNDQKKRKEDMSWMFGFFSGYNQFASGSTKATWFHYDEPGLINAVDHECITFPERPTAEIAVGLLHGIEKAKQP